MHKANKHSFEYIKATVAVMLAAVFAALCVGCSFFRELFKPDSIKFLQSGLELSVGDTYNISKILETNATSYTVSTSNSAVVALDEDTLVITAVAIGAANIIAESSSARAELKVVVMEKEDDSITVSASGELVQTYGRTSDITFTVDIAGAPAKYDRVYWYVNDKLEKLQDKATAYVFQPSAVGEYVVTAKCGDYVSNAVVVRVCNDITAEISVSGDLEQSAPFDDIVFTVTATGDNDDYIYYQYFVDGDVLYEGNSGTYSYSPTPGRHTLSVKVNGQTEYSGDGCFRGPITPTVSSVDFDNVYPHTYLKYDAVGNVKVEITFPLGGVEEYSQSDLQYSNLFDENGFDVGSLFDVCASGSTRRMYKFRVKSFGDGDVITESDYSDYFMFTQIPSYAKQYLTTILPSGDLYITSDVEYVRLAEHYVFFRKKKADTTVSFDCYIGYNRSGSASDLWNAAFPMAATSGSYSHIKVSDLGGGVMHTEFQVSTVNRPTTQTDKNGARSAQLHAILPHINYDEDKYRPSDYEFAIDKISRTIEVEYSDELYLAAQNRVRPVPQAESVAAVIYERARAVLRKICTDEMTDIQKAHAIYDWIMWQVTYDTPATKQKVNSESLSAYYLEGVFGDGTTSIGGVNYNPNAVCDGMSKAYVLMCNIEGIPCVRVVGRAGKEGEPIEATGGHAWNKVFVDGGWYVVDCTWGDTHVTFNLDGSTREYELGLHSYLFLTDAQANTTHYEPYRYEQQTNIIYAPQTAKTPINFFTEMTVNGVAINCYVANNENQLNRVREIATAFARAYVKGKKIDVPLSGEHTVNYQAIEIYSECGFTISDSTIVSAVTSAIKSVHRNATVRVLALDDCVLVLMKA